MSGNVSRRCLFRQDLQIMFCNLSEMGQLHAMPKLRGVVIRKKGHREHHWRMVIIYGKV